MTNLASLGFIPAETIIVQPRLVMSIAGLEKQGKTHFALTAPGDIAFFNLDSRIEGVIHKFTGDKTIHVVDINVPEDPVAAKTQWEKFTKAYMVCLQDKAIRTIIIDTATELWELLRMFRFGKLTQIMPMQYGPVNAEFRAIIRKPYSLGSTNVIFLHKMKKEYINNNPTGEYERAGFNDMGFIVQVNAQVYRDEGKDGEFHIYIKDSGQNPEIAGEDLPGVLCDFPTVASLVLPDTNVTDWM